MAPTVPLPTHHHAIALNPQPASHLPRPSACTRRHALRQSLDALLIGLVGLIGFSNAAQAEAALPCAESFLDHQAPQITNPKLTPKTRELCFSAFAVLHSGVTRTPLWVASHLTRDSVDAAEALSRVNAFHPESALPADERATLQDFSRSGFDRGHLTYPVKSILIGSFACEAA